MQRKHMSWFLWTGAPLMVGVIVAAYLTGHLQHMYGVYVRGDPILEMPSTLDLGSCEFGQTAVARFTVANRGNSDLVLDEFRTDCVCNAIEQVVGGRFVRVKSLRLKPNEQAELALKMGARARVGEEMGNVVYFRTNDPTQPEASFVAVMRVTGGITATPTTVLFGTVPSDAEARQVVEIRDSAIRTRSIRQVLSSNPRLFSARLLPASITTGVSEKGGEDALLGRIEVILKPHQPGSILGEVKIYLDDEQHTPDSISVSARIAPMVEASPSTIVLPRASKSGPLYFAKCVCRSTSGEPLTLTLESTPHWMFARVTHIKNDPSVQLVRIEWNTNRAGPFSAEPKASVRFHAQIGNKRTLVEIPVQFHAAPSK